MSMILVTEKVYAEDAPSVKGRLADIMKDAEVRVDEYLLSDSDRRKVMAALRAAAIIVDEQSSREK